MAKTIKEISTSVLQKLGRLPSGQVAPADQIKIVSDAYGGMYEGLLNDSLVNWSATDDIPEFAVFYIKTLLLGMVADDFGVPNQWLALTDTVRLRLAGQIAIPYVPQVIQFEDI